MVNVKRDTARQKKIACFMHTFLHVNRLHRTMIEAGISKLGIHGSQHRMLMVIARNKSICQKEIARQLDISSAAVAVTLNKLEAAELIERNQSFDDARMNHISITEKGAELLKSTRSMFDSIDDACFEGITDEEIDTVQSLLKKMIENLKSSDKH